MVKRVFPALTQGNVNEKPGFSPGFLSYDQYRTFRMPHHCRRVRTQQIRRYVRFVGSDDNQVGSDRVSELKDLLLRGARHGVSPYLVCRNFELFNDVRLDARPVGEECSSSCPPYL